MPAKKRRTRLSSPWYPEIENILYELILKARTEISAVTIINGFVKAGITEKTTTIAAQSVSDDIATDRETLPDELIDMIDGIGFSSKLQSNLLDN